MEFLCACLELIQDFLGCGGGLGCCYI
uniref:Uncharacterized protein n=1 Tax=Anguilla anguilla TaxID=7936 RepID=A0A0E9TB26_ANGAN